MDDCFWNQLRQNMIKVRLIFLKCYCEKLSFCNLMLGEKEWKYVAQQISLAHRTINFSVTEEIYCLRLTVSQAQPTFIWFDSTIIMCKICSKLTIEAPDVLLFLLLLTSMAKWNLVSGKYEKITLLDALKIHFQRFFTLSF